MATTAKAPAPRQLEQAAPWPPSAWAATPLTREDRLQRIAALGERVAAYVRLMGEVGGLGGSSEEMKERAVAAFYERMVLVESQLRRIQDDLRLG
jgi:hypothetical protein